MNTLYPSILQPILDGDMRWGSPSVFARAILIAAGGYTYAPEHRFLSAVPAVAVVGYALALTGRAAVGAHANSNRLVWYGVSGAPVDAVVLYNDSGLARAETPLIAYLDDVDGLPVTPTGRDLELAWPTTTVFEL